MKTSLKVRPGLMKIFWLGIFFLLTGLSGSIFIILKDLGRTVCCLEASVLMIFEAMFITSLVFLIVILLLGREKEH